MIFRVNHYFLIVTTTNQVCNVSWYDGVGGVGSVGSSTAPGVIAGDGQATIVLYSTTMARK